jgi:hypothetical protein
MSKLKIFHVKEKVKLQPTLHFVLFDVQLYKSLIVVIRYILLIICALKSLYNKKICPDIHITWDYVNTRYRTGERPSSCVM